MLFLKKAVAKKEEKVSLVNLLDSKLAGFETARSHKTVHISMLSRDDGFCAREYALLDATGKKRKDEYVAMPRRVAYDTGNALSHLVRNRWLRDDVVGDWKCLVCKNGVAFSKRPKTHCLNCKSKLWDYSEPTFIDPATKATGSIDFFIDLQHGKHYLVEVKTMDKDEFAELAGPYAEHRIRTQLYLRLVERSHSPHAAKIDTSLGLVLYISKGYGKKVNDKITPFKEFLVRADTATADAKFAAGEALQIFRNGGPMPEGICPNSFGKRAKVCPVIQECWSGKYPAGK